MTHFDINGSETETVIPDGVFTKKYGASTVKVSVFFDHQNETTAEDRIMRLMLDDAAKEAV